MTRGRHRGRTGWIAGTLTDRAARGITKAIVHLSDDVELLATSSLAAATQLSLGLIAPQTKTPPADAGGAIVLPERRC